MGLISILSDLGSIGSTTKWAINLYQDLKSKNKKITDSEIFQMMMIIRYKKIELAENGPFGITDSYKFLVYRAENGPFGITDSYKFLVYRAQIAEHHAGLTGIIIDILHIEADLWKNDLKSILKMLEPLTKRMSEAKISKETKYGPLEKFEVENTSKYGMLTGDKWGSYIVELHERAAVSDSIEEHSPGTLDSMFEASHEMFAKKNK